MARGGVRPNAGRPKGQPNKKNQETIAKAAAAGLLPHEFLLAVSQGQAVDGYQPTFEERMKAALGAAPYFAPKLSNVDSTTKVVADDPLTSLLGRIAAQGAKVHDPSQA